MAVQFVVDVILKTPVLLAGVGIVNAFVETVKVCALRDINPMINKTLISANPFLLFLKIITNFFLYN